MPPPPALGFAGADGFAGAKGFAGVAGFAGATGVAFAGGVGGGVAGEGVGGAVGVLAVVALVVADVGVGAFGGATSDVVVWAVVDGALAPVRPAPFAVSFVAWVTAVDAGPVVAVVAALAFELVSSVPPPRKM
jgi:hypothetical protein